MDKINSFVIRQRDNELNETVLPIRSLGGSLYEVVIPVDILAEISTVSHMMFIRYFDYRKLQLKMNIRRVFECSGKKIDLYITIGDNFGIKIN